MTFISKTAKSLGEIFNIDVGAEQPQDEIVDEPEQQSSQSLTVVDDRAEGQLVPVDQEKWEQEDNEIKSAIESDYRDVRSNFKELIDNGNRMLDLAMNVAEGTENPKSIEAVSKLIGQLADINTRLIDLTAKKQDVFIKARPKVNTKFAQALNDDGSQNVIGNVTNNTMFVGSVSDLLKQLQTVDEQQSQDNDDIVDAEPQPIEK